MSCGTPHYHRTFHSRIMAKPWFATASADLRGVYWTIRLLAGQTNNCGSIKLGTGWADRKALVKWLAESVPSADEDRACHTTRFRSAVASLIKSGAIGERPSGRLFIADWVKDHTDAPSPEAERKRRSRANAALADSLTREGSGGSAPLAPASTSTSEEPSASTSVDRDMSQKEAVTCHEESKSKIERKKYIESTSTAAPATAGARGAEPADGSPEAWSRLDVHDPTHSVLWLCQTICREYGIRSRRSFPKLFSECGERVVRDALAEIQDARRQGIPPADGRDGYGGLLWTVARRIRAGGV